MLYYFKPIKDAIFWNNKNIKVAFEILQLHGNLETLYMLFDVFVNNINLCRYSTFR
jgi:hypothetical protein